MNNKQNSMGFLENSKVKLSKLIKEKHLENIDVSVMIKPLTAKEAIGEPGRKDFPIIEGKERVIEAQIFSAKGHAFTDSPGEFIGKIEQILDFPLTTNKSRAIYVATLNAVLRHLDLCEKTVHCKDEEPVKCGKEIASNISKKWGNTKVGLIGLNPAIAESLVQTFGPENVKITDLNMQNINCVKWGVLIWDGRKMTELLVKQSDVVLITGTTLVNATFDHIMNCILKYNKNRLVYGVTAGGVCKLMDLNRICPYGRNQ
jgi:hypothetical protein